MTREKFMWAQKARSEWIIQGDRNTRCFQTIVRQRRARRKISHLKTEDGSFTEDFEVIENIFVNHFRNQFTEIEPRSLQSLSKELHLLPIPKLDQHQEDTLDRLVTEEEIIRVVFQMGSHKAPGPDGIPAFLYQEY